MEWIASAAFGIEGLVKRDLTRLGAERIVPMDTGGVQFEGEAAIGFAANLWLRTADRVLLVISRFEARSFEELFQGAYAIPWEKYLPRDARFPVNAHTARSQLMSPRDCQSIVKKAASKRLSEAYDVEWLDETGFTYEIEIGIRNDQVTVSLNSSGDSLSRRGYRTWNGEAPLRETLAASILLASPWNPRMAFLDPLCGTGTLLIEAAYIALDRAPGLSREFDCEKWAFMPLEDMKSIRAAAQARYDAAKERPVRIAGSDVDPEALELARRHIRQAGVEGRVTVERRDIRDVPGDSGEGVIVTNPPYGDRMGDRRAAQAVAKQIGLLSQRRPNWSFSVITSDRGFEKAYGYRADSRRRLYNGRLECELLTYRGKPSDGGNRV